MSPGSDNLSNEIQILTSRPVLQRVVKNIHFATRYYNIGKVRTSYVYPETPFSVELLIGTEGRFWLEVIAIINENQFTIGKDPTVQFWRNFICQPEIELY